MNENFPRGAGLGFSPASTLDVRNRVMRNVYWLLALSMIPTIFGAYVGIATGFGVHQPGVRGTAMPQFLLMIVWFGMSFAIQRYRNSSLGVGLLLGFTFLTGLLISSLLSWVLAMSNGVALVALAFGGTAIVFAAMATVATVSKRDFSGIGKFMFVGLIIIVLASFANLFLHIPALMVTIAVLAIVIFSGLLLYDVQRVVNGGETNYVTATLAIYLDLINIFTNLLMLLGIFGGNRD